MATLVKVIARLPSVSAMPADVTENTFHCVLNDVHPPADHTAICTAVAAFYTNTPPGGTHGIGYYLANSMSRSANAGSILYYEKASLDPNVDFGSPLLTTHFTLPAAGSVSDFPEEVASVISYNGDLTDVPVSMPNPTPPPAIIRPQSRRRGRLYMGPVNFSAIDEGTLGYVTPSTAFRTDLGLALKKLADDVDTNTTGNLVVYSGAAQETHIVVGGYVDNAWDTQRRRGREASVRTTFTIP